MRTIFLILFLFINNYSEASNITEGSGKFVIKGGKGRLEKTIDIYYHLPTTYDQNTQVLLVLPGAGRNGWSYRDSWVDASEKYNVLILSPGYSDEAYPRFWNYNLARMLSDVTINKEKSAIADYKVVTNSSEWLFSDFDRIFDHFVTQLDLKTTQYDMFGHSAGGQILHRFVLFGGSKKVNQILASNSGWYTVPTFEDEFPYGLTGITNSDDIRKAFQYKLTVFLGQLDNENEKRGHLVQNPQLNLQGTHRLSRGKYFFDEAKTLASQLNAPFNWKLHVVEGVGHDYKNMGKAAASYLYAR